MTSYFVTFRSVTYAQRGERVLRSAGIGCSMQRTPRVLEERGCGYSLALSAGALYQAVAALRQGNVPFRRVYLRDGDGSIREVEL
ncbi:MAG: DUF3343 domain-containing protein [Oscillospiraceae bacterium]|nr:DUF3343 domain-containing protein [Oscillospiraceae bacterium]